MPYYERVNPSAPTKTISPDPPVWVYFENQPPDESTVTGVRGYVWVEEKATHSQNPPPTFGPFRTRAQLRDPLVATPQTLCYDDGGQSYVLYGSPFVMPHHVNTDSAESLSPPVTYPDEAPPKPGPISRDVPSK